LTEKSFKKFCFQNEEPSEVQTEPQYSPSREYFYYIDNKGLIYFEESDIRNITTCLKDTKFLRQFYSNIRKNELGVNPKYPFYSVCWGEYNFLRCNKYPVIFSFLVQNEKNQWVLEYNFIFKLKFEPKKLFLDQEGILYQEMNHKVLRYGVFSTQLMVFMCNHIEMGENSAELKWEGQTYSIKILGEGEISGSV
jgi:hypothetical protein